MFSPSYRNRNIHPDLTAFCIIVCQSRVPLFARGAGLCSSQSLGGASVSISKEDAVGNSAHPGVIVPTHVSGGNISHPAPEGDQKEYL